MSPTRYFCRIFVVAVLALGLPMALPRAAHAGHIRFTPLHGASAWALHPALTNTTRSADLAPPPDAPAGVDATIPITIQVPAGNHAYLTGYATGVQIYTCAVSGTVYAWSSAVPGATLYNEEGDPIATHYAGPTWQASDGSTVVGHKLASVTVAPDSIPWLLLSAVTTTVGSGDTLSETTYIQRLFTRGGLTPPAANCNAGTLGTTASVPYTARYVFWRADAIATSARSAKVGQSLTVTATNLAAGEPVQVSWDVTGTTPLATGNANASGVFSATVSIPAGLYTTHTILVIGQSSGATDFAYVQVRPRLALQPTAGPAGTQVVATGDGYGAIESVVLSLDSPGGAVLGSTTSDGLGSFAGSTAVTFTVPLGTPPGPHLIYGVGQSSGAQAAARFTVR